VSEADRIRELEEALRERDARIAVLEQRIRELTEQIEAWKRGHRVRPGGKAAQKPSRKASGRGPGRAQGHPGTSRTAPEKVDRTVEVPVATQCPFCGGAVEATEEEPGEQTVEDLRAEPQTEVVVYRRHKGRCTQCHKPVLAPIPEGLGPNPKVGVRAQAQVVEMKSDGQTLLQIQRQLGRQGLELSRGGIQQILHRSALVLEPARELLRVRIVEGSHVWADETGYRVAGQSGYLWMIRGHRAVLFEADRSRGQEVAQRLLEGFTGTLHTDFYAVYWTLPGVWHQPCWGHLLRTTRQLAERTSDPGALELSITLSKIYVEGVRAQARPDTAERHAIRLERALEDLADDPTLGSHPDVVRLQTRIDRHAEELMTFVTDPEAEATNNRSERTVRGHAMARHRSGGARSDQGAKTYAINLSVTKTCELQQISFEDVLRNARRAWFEQMPFPNLIPRGIGPPDTLPLS
jgi:transposase